MSASMKILVCIKQVADPEGPASAFDIDSEQKKIVIKGIPPVINPFDENALEAALKLKDKFGAHVIAINVVDDKLSMAVLKKALAAGADELVILEDKHFVNIDASSKAYVLASTIRQIGDYSLVLLGRQTADWGSGQIGMIIAEILQLPCIHLARRVDLVNNGLLVERIRKVGSEVLKVQMPSLATVDSEIGELRLPLLKDIKEASKKPIHVFNASLLNLDIGKLRIRAVHNLKFAPPRKRECYFIEGATPQERGSNLASKLREDRVI